MFELGNIYQIKKEAKRKKLVEEIEQLEDDNYKKKQLQNKLELMDKKNNPKWVFKGGTYVKTK